MKWLALYLTLCAVMVLSQKYPEFNYPYHVPFDETINQNKTSYKIKGQIFYDPVKNRERVDFSNGRHNFFCGSIVKEDTPCQSLTVGGYRFEIFPEKKYCCMCCTADHGCGILRPDWLKDADYQGVHETDSVGHDLWHIKGKTRVT